jgi:hypothetical protein
MRSHGKALTATLAAAVLLAAATTTATANRLQLTSTTFRAVFTPIEFVGLSINEFRGRCNVTLEGSFHRASFAKSTTVGIGLVTRFAQEPCTGSQYTVLARALPWEIRYASFTGTLPAMTAVGISIGGFEGVLLTPSFGVSCLYAKSESLVPWTLVLGRGGVISSLRANEMIALPLHEGSPLDCPERIGYAGASTLTVLNGRESISARLI